MKSHPVNSTASIEYKLREISQVKIDIYDILGRKVSTLIDEAKEPGTHIARFNTDKFASGVYTYRMTIPNLETEGYHMETKKLQIMK